MFIRSIQKPTKGLLGLCKKPGTNFIQKRAFANVEGNTPRQMPNVKSGQMRPSYDTANLSIRGGPMFTGKSFGAKMNVSGEAVFTTSLVLCIRKLTYRTGGQILVFTQPLIGNYGVPSSARDEHGLLRYFESPNIQAVGVVVADVSEKYSHWTAVESLSQWCSREGVPAVSGVDTRAIVSFLREEGSSLAKITVGDEYDGGSPERCPVLHKCLTDDSALEEQDEAFVDPEQINLVRKVSTKSPFHVSSSTGDLHVAVLDCGVKENILRSLVSRGASVTCFPYDYPIEKVAHHFDGVFISNGPGDPTHCQETVISLRKLMNSSQIPIMGICLGHQLVGIAAGAKTLKMKYGNRAHNIPALDLTTGRTHITSQNHGYAIDAQTLPREFKEFFVNLNDSSNEGIIHISRPIMTTQFHPEAKGGPMDSAYLFDNYLESVKRYRDTQAILQPQRDNKPSSLLRDLLGKERVGVVPTLGMESMARAAGKEAPAAASAA
ncbi:Multifunctional pyrimidine synthesis protein CAD [Lecanora helva]